MTGNDGDVAYFSVDHGSWFDFTRSWWNLKSNENIFVVFYEDMKKVSVSMYYNNNKTNVGFMKNPFMLYKNSPTLFYCCSLS